MQIITAMVKGGGVNSSNKLIEFEKELKQSWFLNLVLKKKWVATSGLLLTYLRNYKVDNCDKELSE